MVGPDDSHIGTVVFGMSPCAPQNSQEGFKILLCVSAAFQLGVEGDAGNCWGFRRYGDRGLCSIPGEPAEVQETPRTGVGFTRIWSLEPSSAFGALGLGRRNGRCGAGDPCGETGKSSLHDDIPSNSNKSTSNSHNIKLFVSGNDGPQLARRAAAEACRGAA